MFVFDELDNGNALPTQMVFIPDGLIVGTVGYGLTVTIISLLALSHPVDVSKLLTK